MTASEAGTLGAADVDVLQRAHSQVRVLVTSDDDFLRQHHQGRDHSGIPYYYQRTASIGRLVTGLTLIYKVLERDEIVGQLEYL